MLGMNRNNGRRLSGIEHILHSIRDILTTPLGSRVMRREYGSRLFNLIDTPVNENTKIEFYAAAAEAIRRWEPRIKLEKISIASVAASGSVTFDLLGVILANGEPLKIEGLTVA